MRRWVDEVKGEDGVILTNLTAIILLGLCSAFDERIAGIVLADYDYHVFQKYLQRKFL